MATEKKLKKRAGGAPSSYNSAFCERVVEFGKEGWSRVMIACELGVARNTLATWEKKHPAFQDALSRARDESQAWWEKQGLDNLSERNFNANLYKLHMVNRFPDDWKDQRQIEVKTALDKLDLAKLPNRALQRIADGEHPLVVVASLVDEVMQKPAELLRLPPASEEGEG